MFPLWDIFPSLFQGQGPVFLHDALLPSHDHGQTRQGKNSKQVVRSRYKAVNFLLKYLQ